MNKKFQIKIQLVNEDQETISSATTHLIDENMAESVYLSLRSRLILSLRSFTFAFLKVNTPLVEDQLRWRKDGDKGGPLES